MNIASHFLDIFAATPNKAAVVSPKGETVTYREILDDIDQARSILRASGLSTGARVVLQVPAGRHFTAWAIALVAEGMVTVGIDLAHGPDVYLDRAATAGAEAVICAPVVVAAQRLISVLPANKLSKQIPPALDLLQIVSRLGTDRRPATKPFTQPVLACDEEETAFIIFTGGTTSTPKGVRLSHRAIRSYVGALAALPEWDAISSFVADQPQQVLYGLAHNKTVFVAPARSGRHAKYVADLLFAKGVDAYFGSPTRWASILETDVIRAGTTSPQAVLLGGATVTPAILSQLDEALPKSTAIRCIYGMTELGPVAHVEGREKLARTFENGDYVGRLFPGVRATVSADNILSVQSRARFSGYLDDPDADQDELFETSDRAAVAGQELTLEGRTSDMIVADGVNLYAGQFESRLLELETGGQAAFSNVALVGVTVDVLGDERFLLFYRPTEAGRGIGPDQALELTSPLFPKGLGPVRAERLDPFPTTGRQGKIDRSALRSLAEQTMAAPTLSDQRNRLMEDLDQCGIAKRHLIPINVLTQRNLRWATQLQPANSTATSPLFILGHQRSGTTAMHRGLCASPSATALSVSDMMLPHPLAWKHLPLLTQFLDRRNARYETPSNRLREIDAKHGLSLSAPEEEEWLFAGLGLSSYLPSAFEKSLGDERFEWLRRRDQWPEETRHELLKLYAGMTAAWQRSKALGNATTVVAKNPAFGPLATDLADHFPTSRFVVMVREPEHAINSRIALISTIHERSLTRSEIHVIVSDSLHQMEQMAIGVQKLSQDVVSYVDSEAFRENPAATVRTVSKAVGLQAPRTSDLSFLGASHREASAFRSIELPDLFEQAPEYVRLYEEVST